MNLSTFLTVTLILAAGQVQAGTPDANEIVRSLAPLPQEAAQSGTVRRAIDLEIRFKSGSAKLTKPARILLARLAMALKSERLAHSRFQIAGHTDASGGRAYNRRLSERRARAVVRFLVAYFGIDRRRLTAVGRGEDALKDPLRPTSVVNRRVEIVNLTPIQGIAVPRRDRTWNRANDILKGR